MQSDRRCLTCHHFGSDEANPAAEERAVEMRYGPEAALVGRCEHPEHRMTVNTKFGCEDWRGTAAAPEGLVELAAILSEWIAPAPGVSAIYVFGSRVRGDHRPDSDVDIRLYLAEWSGDDDGATSRWWANQNATDFAALKALLPGRLEIHRDDPDAADAAIRAGATDPVLVHGRVVCVWTPRRP